MAIVVSPALRRPASAVPSITGLRISPPGFKATLVNISPSGLVAEWGLALKIGQTVTIAFEGKVTPQSVGALVVRSSIASASSAGLRYHVAIAFTSRIPEAGDADCAVGHREAPTHLHREATGGSGRERGADHDPANRTGYAARPVPRFRGGPTFRVGNPS